MKILCLDCNSEIPLGDVNVSTDLALCRRCEKTFSYAELVEGQSEDPIDVSRPPRGTWFKQSARGFEVGASTRHPMAFFLVPFMCVWSGFSLGGIYGTQIQKGEFNLGMSLFGIPFVLGTLLFGSIAAMSVCGKTYVRVENDQGVVFTGVGALGWRRRFKWSDTRRIKVTPRLTRGGSTNELTLLADRPIDFASGLNSTRLHFLIGVLQKLLRERR